MDLIVGTKDLMAFFGVAQTTTSLWKSNGCPNAGHGKWNLKEVFDWWQDNIMSSKVDDKDSTLSAVKLDYWRSKAEWEQIKVDKEKEELIPRKAIATMWATRLSEVSNGLQSLSMRLPPLLEGKSQPEMRTIIDNEQWQMRDNFCRKGRFCEQKEAKPVKKPKKKAAKKTKKKISPRRAAK